MIVVTEEKEFLLDVTNIEEPLGDSPMESAVEADITHRNELEGLDDLTIKTGVSHNEDETAIPHKADPTEDILNVDETKVQVSITETVSEGLHSGDTLTEFSRKHTCDDKSGDSLSTEVTRTTIMPVNEKHPATNSNLLEDAIEAQDYIFKEMEKPADLVTKSSLSESSTHSPDSDYGDSNKDEPLYIDETQLLIRDACVFHSAELQEMPKIQSFAAETYKCEVTEFIPSQQIASEKAKLVPLKSDEDRSEDGEFKLCKATVVLQSTDLSLVACSSPSNITTEKYKPGMHKQTQSQIVKPTTDTKVFHQRILTEPHNTTQHRHSSRKDKDVKQMTFHDTSHKSPPAWQGVRPKQRPKVATAPTFHVAPPYEYKQSNEPLSIELLKSRQKYHQTPEQIYVFQNQPFTSIPLEREKKNDAIICELSIPLDTECELQVAHDFSMHVGPNKFAEVDRMISISTEHVEESEVVVTHPIAGVTVMEFVPKATFRGLQMEPFQRAVKYGEWTEAAVETSRHDSEIIQEVIMDAVMLPPPEEFNSSDDYETDTDTVEYVELYRADVVECVEHDTVETVECEKRDATEMEEFATDNAGSKLNSKEKDQQTLVSNAQINLTLAKEKVFVSNVANDNVSMNKTAIEGVQNRVKELQSPRFIVSQTSGTTEEMSVVVVRPPSRRHMCELPEQVVQVSIPLSSDPTLHRHEIHKTEDVEVVPLKTSKENLSEKERRESLVCEKEVADASESSESLTSGNHSKAQVYSQPCDHQDGDPTEMPTEEVIEVSETIQLVHGTSGEVQAVAVGVEDGEEEEGFENVEFTANLDVGGKEKEVEVMKKSSQETLDVYVESIIDSNIREQQADRYTDHKKDIIDDKHVNVSQEVLSPISYSTKKELKTVDTVAKSFDNKKGEEGSYDSSSSDDSLLKEFNSLEELQIIEPGDDQDLPKPSLMQAYFTPLKSIVRKSYQHSQEDDFFEKEAESWSTQDFEELVIYEEGDIIQDKELGDQGYSIVPEERVDRKSDNPAVTVQQPQDCSLISSHSTPVLVTFEPLSFKTDDCSQTIIDSGDDVTSISAPLTPTFKAQLPSHSVISNHRHPSFTESHVVSCDSFDDRNQKNHAVLFTDSGVSVKGTEDYSEITSYGMEITDSVSIGGDTDLDEFEDIKDQIVEDSEFSERNLSTGKSNTESISLSSIDKQTISLQLLDHQSITFLDRTSPKASLKSEKTKPLIIPYSRACDYSDEDDDEEFESDIEPVGEELQYKWVNNPLMQTAKRTSAQSGIDPDKLASYVQTPENWESSRIPISVSAEGKSSTVSRTMINRCQTGVQTETERMKGILECNSSILLSCLQVYSIHL